MGMPQSDDEAGLLQKLADAGLNPARLRVPPGGLAGDAPLRGPHGFHGRAHNRAGVNDQMSERREVEKLKEGCQKFSEQGFLPKGQTVDALIAGFKAERKYGDPHVSADDYLAGNQG